MSTAAGVPRVGAVVGVGTALGVAVAVGEDNGLLKPGVNALPGATHSKRVMPAAMTYAAAKAQTRFRT